VLEAVDQDMATFLRRRLFEPLGISSAIPKFDAAGTWIASSYCFATAQDFLRFGLLYLRDGVVDGRRLLPEGWVEDARTPQPGVDDEGWGYARHWWTLPSMPGAFFANGHAGQFVFLVPQHDLIVFRSGTSPTGVSPLLVAYLTAVIDAAVGASPAMAG
jgi:CubicO group peptidase (beta-lactamase class C family)